MSGKASPGGVGVKVEHVPGYDGPDCPGDGPTFGPVHGNPTASEVRFRMLSDDDGHKFLVPVGKEGRFAEIVEKIGRGTDTADDWKELDGFRRLGGSPSRLSFADPRED